MRNSEFRMALTCRRARALRLGALFFVNSGFWMLNSSAAPSAAIVEVKATRAADLVLLDAGFNAGLRQGMVCRVTRGTTEIAEVLLVELRPQSSAALILSVAPQPSI